MNGKLNIDGVEYWLSGWWKQGKSGEFLSLALGQRVEQQQEAQHPAPQPMRGRGRPQQQEQYTGNDGFEDNLGDVPF